MPLEEYRRKRNFQETPEPGGQAAAAAGQSFVVQKHAATRLHYDFRLEIDGVLKSWAVPKGPSLNPADKRLAVMTEDHPLAYGGFEGVIPKGNYGAGEVIVWDNGTFQPEGALSASEQLARGELKFTLTGKKLRGSFVLVRTKRPPGKDWLLIKHRDEAADPSWNIDAHDGSVLSGRTLDEIKQGAPPHAMEAGGLDGAKPGWSGGKVFSPMLATPAEKPFSDPAWLFELKWDGMRILAAIRDGKCELMSRRGRDVTTQFPELAVLPRRIAASEAILDGEIVVLDADGRSNFERMQRRMHVAAPSPGLLEKEPVACYLFDILFCDGFDLRAAPLIERKELLKRLLNPGDPLRYSDHVREKGEGLFRLASEQGLEGIVGKRIRSPYTAGRSSDWVKIKSTREVDAVVGGFTAPRGGREHFGALLIGLYEKPGGNRLHWAGAVGSGFTGESQREVWSKLEKLTTGDCPFEPPPETQEKATWVKPELVARVRFTEWTSGRHLRAPVFLGLRDDIDPGDCTAAQDQPAPPPEASHAEAPLPQIEKQLCESKAESLTLDFGGKTPRLTHLDKIYFPEEGYTKRDLLCYYLRVAPLILPFLRDRPLVLRRLPDGISGQLFYQKEAGDYAPDWIKTFSIDGVRYFVAEDLADLLYLTNLGCIDHDPWSSRTGDLEHPDYLFLDFDPTDDTEFAVVVEVARAAHQVLADAGLKAYLKTSGASGFHIYIPLDPGYTYAQARRFAEIVMRIVAVRLPDLTTFERTVEKRPHGRVYLDFSQFSQGRPLASVYSVRPVLGACVSAPVTPAELRSTLTPRKFTLKTMPSRLLKVGDLWADFWDSPQRLESALEKIRP
jgi:bifunctional non-homologous end joining protein LigD